MSTDEGVEILVPSAGIARFLDERFGVGSDPVSVSRLGEGHSNLTFLIKRGEMTAVLRRPPRGEILPSTHDMSREFRVMDALWSSGGLVPVPAPIAWCAEESFIGSPFYLMDLVDGVVVRDRVPGTLDSPDGLRQMGMALADTLAAVHGVPWQEIGLGDFSRKPQEFLVRNVNRMQQLYDLVRHRDVVEIDQAGEWLRANLPVQRATTLTHGDFKLDNVMFAPDAPPTVVAVVDWEISAIGDPMVDLGWMLYFSRQAGDPASGLGTVVTESPGYPTRAELAHRYATVSGMHVENLPFYTALAGWKIAIIMEGSYRRFLEGMADDELFGSLDGIVPALARRSLDVISGDVAVW